MATAFAHNLELQQIQSMPIHPLPPTGAIADVNGDQTNSNSGQENEATDKNRHRPLSSDQHIETNYQTRHRSHDNVQSQEGDVEDGNDEDDDDKPNLAAVYALYIQGAVYGVFLGRGDAWRRFAVVVAVCLFAVYFGYAEQYDFRRNIGLLVFTVIAVLIFAYK